MALDPKQRTTIENRKAESDRKLYFHSLASEFESSVPLRIINNASVWEGNPNAAPREFKTIGRRGIQTGGMFVHFKFFVITF